jgi:CheY-like chemotaxis protein
MNSALKLGLDLKIKTNTPHLKEYLRDKKILKISLVYTLIRLYCALKSHRPGLYKALLILTSIISKKKFHIILADDDEDDRDIFILALKEVAPEIKVTAAESGVKLMSILQKTPNSLPDIIFLDLNMPAKNGQECLEEIRMDENLSKIPVIIYSTSSSSEHIDDTYKKGADYYVSKPTSFNDLKLIANKLLSLEWKQHRRPARDKFFVNASQLK